MFQYLDFMMSARSSSLETCLPFLVPSVLPAAQADGWGLLENLTSEMSQEILETFFKIPHHRQVHYVEKVGRKLCVVLLRTLVNFQKRCPMASVDLIVTGLWQDTFTFQTHLLISSSLKVT